MTYNQTFLLHKKCERCEAPLPDDFGNLLCEVHYTMLVEEQEKQRVEREAQAKGEMLKNPENPTHPKSIEALEPVSEEKGSTEVEPAPATHSTRAPSSECDHATCGIQDPAYKENSEQDDKDQVLANLAQFVYTHRDKEHPRGRKHGILLYYPQRNMYNFLKNYMMQRAMSHPQYPKYIWKPKVVDVGCGSGVGSNILSLEADMVWGIDKNDFSLEFAKEAFTREKNGIYYSSQLTFDHFDILTDDRQVMAFDIVVAIEVAEHIADINGFLNAMKRFTKRDKKGGLVREWGTEFFISTPNRNNKKIRKDRPENIFHVREWTSQEFKALLLKHFENVELMNDKGEPVLDDSDHQIIFAKCALPI